jgi:hypothetical protein
VKQGEELRWQLKRFMGSEEEGDRKHHGVPSCSLSCCLRPGAGGERAVGPARIHMTGLWTSCGALSRVGNTCS